MQEDEIKEVLLEDVNLDRETQIRVKISEETIQRYFEVMVDEAARDQFPPILLFRDPEGRLWTVDGHHRSASALRRKFKSIRAIIRPGTKADAIWEAAKANGRNGLQLGRADVHRAIGMLLDAWPDRSNVMIAEAVGCNEGTVRRHRTSFSTSARAEVGRTIGKDGKSRPSRRKKVQGIPVPKTTSVIEQEIPVSQTESAVEGVACDDDLRQIAIKAKEEEVDATLDDLKNKIDDWYKTAPLDMHVSFTRRLCQQIIRLNAIFECKRCERLLKQQKTQEDLVPKK